MAAESFQGRTIAEVGTRLDGDLAATIRAGAYRASVDAATAAVSAPRAMQTVCHLSFGDFSGSDYAAQLLLDTVVHGWVSPRRQPRTRASILSSWQPACRWPSSLQASSVPRRVLGGPSDRC